MTMPEVVEAQVRQSCRGKREGEINLGVLKESKLVRVMTIVDTRKACILLYMEPSEIKRNFGVISLGYRVFVVRIERLVTQESGKS